MSAPTVIGNLQLETFRDSVATAEGSKVKRKHADLSTSCITSFPTNIFSRVLHITKYTFRTPEKLYPGVATLKTKVCCTCCDFVLE